MDAILGVELGSTRIKAVLTDATHTVLAQGSHTWENDYQDGVWTYPLDAVWVGLRAAVTQALDALPGVQVRAMGFSGMMHGYLAFDGEGRLLVPFRTWRNTFTARASQELTALFGFPIPQRWSIAHLYHAMLQNEPHVRSVHRLSTLASYVHETLTGRRTVGVGEASGMFPIDAQTPNYDQRMLSLFDERAQAMGMPWHIRELLPEALPAGACAGYLTQDGAQSAGSCRALAGRHPPGSARRRRRHGHGSHQRRTPAHRQRLRRHIHLFHGRAGAPAVARLSAIGRGGHPGRQPRRHGALQ